MQVSLHTHTHIWWLQFSFCISSISMRNLIMNRFWHTIWDSQWLCLLLVCIFFLKFLTTLCSVIKLSTLLYNSSVLDTISLLGLLGLLACTLLCAIMFILLWTWLPPIVTVLLGALTHFYHLMWFKLNDYFYFLKTKTTNFLLSLLLFWKGIFEDFLLSSCYCMENIKYQRALSGV